MKDACTLLGKFFSEGKGHVLYKAYPRTRGDDVSALLHLANSLPPNTISFVPVPPEQDSIRDLHSVQKQLVDACAPTPDATDSSGVRSGAEAREARLKELLRVLPSDLLDDHAVKTLRELAPRQLLDALYEITRNSLSARQELDQVVHIPEDAPVLIVGRPELLLGYEAAPGGKLSSLRKLLDSAGYPNRFHFLVDRGNEGRAGGIRDLKTLHDLLPDKPPQDSDLGFVFIGRSKEGQAVMVASGVSSLGTFAAVELLLDRRPALRPAIDAVESAQGRDRIDIVFRCEHQQLVQDRPFRYVNPASRLRIELLNADDVVGYRWSRGAHARFGRLLDAWSPAVGSTPAKPIAEEWGQGKRLEWSWRAPQVLPVHSLADKSARDRDGAAPLATHAAGSPASGAAHRLLPVRIDATAYQASPSQILLPGRAMGQLLDAVRADARKDRAAWIGKLPKPDGGDRLQQMRMNPRFQTFVPVLIIGPTGSGKQWIAQLIAESWGGASIAAQVNSFSAGGDRRLARNGLLDRTEEELETSLSDFIAGQSMQGPHLHTFNTVGTSDLIDAELFGTAQGIATTVDSAPGAFQLAGTGVLFLDELLELDPSLQAKLLMALQNGRILPIGAGRDYCFVCRVVAATNRAEDAQSLRRAVDRKEVRHDLTARFARQYVVPPLSQRPLEVIPILMMLLKERHNIAEEAGDTSPLYLRISKPAFEALISYDFPENIRNLQQLAGVLSPEVISLAPFAAGSDDLPRCSILLRDVRILDGAGPEQAAGTGNPPHERNFYEFALSYLVSKAEEALPQTPAAISPEPAAIAGQPTLSEFARKLATIQFPPVRIAPSIDGRTMEQFLVQPGVADSLARLVGAAFERISPCRRRSVRRCFGSSSDSAATWPGECRFVECGRTALRAVRRPAPSPTGTGNC